MMTTYKTNKPVRKTALYSSVMIAAILSSTSATAQTFVDEIVVTAQKRDQNLQDVPIAIQVVGSDFIEDLAADNISDISQFIPGLDVGAGSPTQPRYTIRGISTSDFGVGTDAAVGVYVDGVYSARSGAAVLSFGDIERIEVLKGPQGTLFGRNAAAGAVSIITNKPHDEFEAHVKARIGNYGKKRGELMVNYPIADSLALRVNALYNERDGLYTDAATGEDLSRQQNWATRAALKWDVSSKTSATLSWVHDELDQDARPAIGIVDLPAFPAIPPAPAIPADYLDPKEAPLLNDVVDNHETRNLDELTLIINHEFGNIDFTSTSSWREFQTENREDEDGTNRIDLYFDTNNREENESWYQEFKLTGETGAFNWLVGASYFEEKANQVSDATAFTDSIGTALANTGNLPLFQLLEDFIIIPNDFPGTAYGHEWKEEMFNEGDFSAYAAYADVIFAVNDRLNLTVGGRYTKDKKSFQWFNDVRSAPTLDATLNEVEALGLFPPGFGPETAVFDIVFDQSATTGVPCDNGVSVAEGVTCVLDRSYEDFSPRFVVDYQVTDDILAFASFAKGYKAGGFNSVEIASEFDNEDVSNYEFGFKSTFPELNLLLNASGFHYVYKDKQAIRLVTPDGADIPQYLVETSDDQAWGADLQVLWGPNDTVDFFGNWQYIDATFKSRVTRDGTDLSGEPTGEPEWSAGFGARVKHDLSNGSRLSGQVAHAYRGKSRTNSDSVRQGEAAVTTAFKTGTARHRTDLRLSWTSPSEKYEWGVYGNNVFNNIYVGGVNNLTADTFGTPFSSLTEPAFYGTDLKVNF